MRAVWVMSVIPIVRGCRSRVNINEVIIRVAESVIKSISEGSLIKILVLGIDDGVYTPFPTL